MFGGNLPPQRPQIFSTCGGVLTEEFIGKLFGESFAKLLDCAIFNPQRPQNFEKGGNVVEQRGHGKLVVCVSPSLMILKERLPHLPQNFTPCAKRALQLVQATMPGITLDCGEPLLLLPPPVSEVDGWLLAAPRSGFSCA